MVFTCVNVGSTGICINTVYRDNAQRCIYATTVYVYQTASKGTGDTVIK